MIARYEAAPAPVGNWLHLDRYVDGKYVGGESYPVKNRAEARRIAQAFGAKVSA